MCMTQEKSTQINTSKQEGNIVSDWLHHCCTLDNSAGFFSAANQKTAGKPEGNGGRRGSLRVWAFGFWLQQFLCSFQSITARSPVNEFTKPPQEDPERPASTLWRGGGGGLGLEELEGEEEKIGVKKKKRLWFPTPYPCWVMDSAADQGQ